MRSQCPEPLQTESPVDHHQDSGRDDRGAENDTLGTMTTGGADGYAVGKIRKAPRDMALIGGHKMADVNADSGQQGRRQGNEIQSHGGRSLAGATRRTNTRKRGGFRISSVNPTMGFPAHGPWCAGTGCITGSSKTLLFCHSRFRSDRLHRFLHCRFVEGRHGGGFAKPCFAYQMLNPSTTNVSDASTTSMKP